MPDITMTRQTNLRGTALQNAVNTMMAAVGRRRPFSMTQIASRWESGSRLTFVSTALGQTQATGSIDIRDGSPSTVVASVDLLTTTSRNARGDVERAMVEESDRALQPVAGAAQASTQTATQTSSQTSSQTQRPAASSADRWAQWGQASNILGEIFGGAATGLDAFNQQMGYAAAQEAVQVASQEAQRAGVGKAAVVAPPPRASVVRTQAQPAPLVAAPFPTWGWVLLGLGGAGLVAFVIWTGVTRHG